MPVLPFLKPLVGLAFQTAGDIAKGEAEKAADAADLKELYRASSFAQANAADSLQRGAYAAGLKRMATSAILGKQRLAFNNSGVDASVGTPAEVAGSTNLVGELDAMQLENNATREAFGHSESARAYGKKAETLRQKLAMKDWETAGNVVGSILSTGAGLLGGGK